MTDPGQRPSIDAHLRRPWRERDEASHRRSCTWPGCTEEGTHRAPRSRTQLRDYIWLCLLHVREYNQHWDFFAGMSTDEIDAYRRRDVTWHRPTWRLSSGPAWTAFCEALDDPFGLFAETGWRPPRQSPVVDDATRMMKVLGLGAGFTLVELKRRYKDLVKKHHPDLHGGDKKAEEQLRVIIEAYRYLLDNGVYA